MQSNDGNDDNAEQQVKSMEEDGQSPPAAFSAAGSTDGEPGTAAVDEPEAIFVGTSDGRHWYTDIDPDSGFQYWYSIDPDTGESLESQWTRPNGLDSNAPREKDAAAAEAPACSLCESLQLYTFHRDSALFSCCETCGWVERLVDNEANADSQRLAEPLSPSPQRDLVATSTPQKAREFVEKAGHKLATNLAQARRLLATRASQVRAKMSKTTKTVVTKGQSFARRAPPAFLAQKVRAVAKFRQARSWSIDKIAAMKAAAAKRYPAYFSHKNGDDAVHDSESSEEKNLRQFRALLVAGFDAVNIRRRSYEQSLHILRPGDSMYLECAVLKHNVVVEVIRRDMRPGGAIETPAIPPETVEAGTFFTKHLHLPPSASNTRAVQIIVRFNNSASWFTGKDVAFRVLVSAGGPNSPAKGSKPPVPTKPPPPKASGDSSDGDGVGIPVLSTEEFLHTSER